MNGWIVLFSFLVGAIPARAWCAEPIRIGLSLGLTGVYAKPAQMQQRGYELWRDELNAGGGLLGRPVELDLRDDRGDPAVAVRHYRALIEQARVELILGPYSSAVTQAVAPVADAAGYPMLAAGASGDGIWKKGYRNVFGMWAPASQYSHGMLRLAYEAGLGSVAILRADDEFSRWVADGTVRWARYLDFEIVKEVAFVNGAPDLTSEVREALRSAPQLLVVAGHWNEAMRARGAFSANGGRLPAFFATVGPALAAWGEVLGPIADGAFATSIWEPTVTYPKSEEFVLAFVRRYAVEPSYHAATAYAAGQILVTAVRRSRSLEGARVREALFGLDVQTIIGRFGVDRTGMQVKSIPLIVQWQQGRKAIVWPELMRSTQPVFR